MAIQPILVSLRRHKLPVALIVLEISLTCFIALNAAFLASQLIQRSHIQSGVVENELVLIRVAHNAASSSNDGGRTQAALAALEALPGVESVTVTNQMPFGGSRTSSAIRQTPDQASGTSTSAATYYGEHLVDTFGLQLVVGRDFIPSDYVDSDAFLNGETKPSVAIITRDLAKHLWPNDKALGKSLYVGEPVRVVGVVAQLLQPASLGGPHAHWSMILPVRMMSADGLFVLRTQGAKRSDVLKHAATALRKLDPKRILTLRATLGEQKVKMSRQLHSLLHVMLTVMVALLAVTALGIVGLTSFWVTQRRRSIGVRRALGARRSDILHYFQIENFLIVTLGVVIGMTLAVGLNLLLMRHFQMPHLPWGYLPIGALILWLLGQLAVLGPALRASRVPPVVAVRSE